jgi:hypothetical protein
MDLAYNIFFSLQVTLGGTASTLFSFAPDNRSQGVFARHDLIFKSREGYFFVAGTTLLDQQQAAILPYPLAGMQKFTFLMTLSDVTGFLGQADLQLSGQDTSRVGRGCYYFNNLDASGMPDGGASAGSLVLSRQATVGVADLWSVIPSSYGFYVDPSKYTEVQLYQVNAEAAPAALPPVFTAGSPAAQFKLNGYAPGPFQLKWIGSPAREEYVYADPALASSAFFALVEIYKDSSANTVLLNGPPLTYTIPFKAV